MTVDSRVFANVQVATDLASGSIAKYSGARASDAARALWWAVAIGMVLALLAPLLVVQAAPLLDYLNHLARFVVLAAGADDPVLSSMYAPHWSIIPNLGLDLVVPPLLRIMPVLDAGRIAVGAVILLPVLGTIAYSRAVFGTSSYWPLGVGLVAYNATVLLGFMNFVAGIGLALLLAAAWISRRDRHPAAAILLGTVASVGLFFCHMMGLALFLVLIGAFEAEQVWRKPRSLLRRAAAMLPLMAAPAVLYGLSSFQRVQEPTLFLPPRDKALQLLVPFLSYDLRLDVITAALVGVGVLGCVAGGWARTKPHVVLALATLALLYCVSPFISKGTCFLDTRFAIMLGYLLFGAILPVRVPRRVAALAAIACVGVFAWRMTAIAAVWQEHTHDLTGMRAVIADVRPGERVYVTTVTPEEAPDYWQHAPRSRRLSNGVRVDYHMPALLLMEHRAFWPYLFADPAQQPVVPRAPYQLFVSEALPLLAHRQLDTATSRPLCDYDDVLLLGAGGEPDLAGFAGNRLRLLQANDVAALFRVLPPAKPGICPAR